MQRRVRLPEFNKMMYEMDASVQHVGILREVSRSDKDNVSVSYNTAGVANLQSIVLESCNLPNSSQPACLHTGLLAQGYTISYQTLENFDHPSSNRGSPPSLSPIRRSHLDIPSHLDRLWTMLNISDSPVLSDRKAAILAKYNSSLGYLDRGVR